MNTEQKRILLAALFGALFAVGAIGVIALTFGCGEAPTDPPRAVRSNIPASTIVDSLSGTNAGWTWTTFTDGRTYFVYMDPVTNTLLAQSYSMVPDSIKARVGPKVVIGGGPRGKDVKKR